MGYGLLNENQTKVVRDFVRGRIVHDLGAGDLTLARKLLDLGASHVIAVDKERGPTRHPKRLTYKQVYFHELREPVETIFLSWPQNYMDQALVRLVFECKRLCYLGKNSDGTSCGHPLLFEAMLYRELVAYVPAKGNSLVILGERLQKPREPTPEENAGLMMYSQGVLSYESIEQEM